MIDWWWSYLLTVVGVTGIYLTTRKLWWGFAVGLAAQVLWTIYAVVTHQYGFLFSVLAYGSVHALGLWRWTRSPAEGSELHPERYFDDRPFWRDPDEETLP
ncbi:hypothetical protein BI081_gp123 [Mycobacterium phage Tonenili]|uniref:PnuC-like nicotinamide riboside transporter n=1 Tax=Mycobacterium phage Tonenili TaxID=1891703 RepID=A0A1C9EHL7_9CAUD|nr:hypothetical protein BI081_gp123 [Mycobacterium phage Tonenili]AON96984.1 PnuC-like nicotinamide riboside transporter [Mycobacterium phage Tonenili]